MIKIGEHMSVLNKPEMINTIASETGESKAAVERVLSSLEKTVTEAIVEGREVKLSGFVAFARSVRSARIMKNPRTGEDVSVPEQNTVRIRPLSRLRKAVND